MVYHTTEYNLGGTGTWGTFDDLKPAVTRAIREVEDRADEFDVIAVQGVSGMSVGFPLACAIGKPIVVVRKDFEIENGNSHSYDRLIGVRSLKGKRCLFVDDFVSMGGTRARVRQAVEADGGKLVAQYMGRENTYTLL